MKIINKIRNIFYKSCDGFSLIEISIVLLIIGIIAGSALKGRDIIESAQIRSLVGDIECINLAYTNYISTYGSLPGDDKNASDRFGSNIQNGDGNGRFSKDDISKIIIHLHAAGLLESDEIKKPKIGGNLDIILENNKAKIRLSEFGDGILSKKQAINIQSKINDSSEINPKNVEFSPSINDANENSKIILKITLGNN